MSEGAGLRAGPQRICFVVESAFAWADLEHGEWLERAGRAEEAAPLLDEARQVFERLRAKPWLERLGQASNVGAQLEESR